MVQCWLFRVSNLKKCPSVNRCSLDTRGKEPRYGGDLARVPVAQRGHRQQQHCQLHREPGGRPQGPLAPMTTPPCAA